LSEFPDGRFAVFYGSFSLDEYVGDITAENLDELASVFGTPVEELLEHNDLIAELVFEYNILDFEENPYGQNPLHSTEDACMILDEWMDESHRDMWLNKED
jgi:hypothetical protein